MTDPQNPYDTGDAPAFGKRSENWSQTPTPAVPVSGESRPWPVYQGGPGIPPQQPGGPIPYGPVGKMPSRAGAVWTLILGIVAAVIVAPIVAVTLIVGAFDLQSFADGSMETTNGGQVMVDDTGTVAVFSGTGTLIESCTVTGAGGESWNLYSEGGTGLMVGRDIPAGEHQIDCDGATGSALIVFAGDDLDSITGASIAAMGWATVIGVLGLVAFVVGIVWLVKRNRARREFKRQMWIAPQGGPQY